MSGRHRLRQEIVKLDRARRRGHAGRPTTVATTTIEPAGQVRDALDEDTAGIPTFELTTPMIAHTVTGAGSLGIPTPSRRTASAPVPFPATKPSRDWGVTLNRLGILVASVGAAAGIFALWQARSVDELQRAATAVTACLVLIGAFSGWAIARPVPCRCGRKCRPL